MAIGNVAGSCVSGDALFAEDARGSKGGPVGQARKLLNALRSGDVVQRGGYPADKGLVRVVGNGQVIGNRDVRGRRLRRVAAPQAPSPAEG